MNLDQIQTKCFILSLFIRDDGERFLLGSGAYEFKDSQLHFVANTYKNDIVEVQGDDGLFLAGQVRRSSKQNFDGYIGDATVKKSDIENYRKDFLSFFRKNYYYTVVYIFPDGSAIQRRKGFIVDAPEVQELYQFYPEYHIALNFEDINYYAYAEDDDGDEIYGKSATIPLIAGAIDGGLIWESSKNILPSNGLDIFNGAPCLTVEPTYVDGALTRIGFDCVSDTETEYTIGYVNFKKGETYTFSGVSGGNYGGIEEYGMMVEPCAAFPTGVQLYDGSITETAVDDADNVRVYLWIEESYIANQIYIYPQIEVGNTATAYEPYQNKLGVVWDNIGAEWEEGSGGGPSIIMVDSIDNVYPIWEVKGPANNPQLSCITTSTTLSYAGNVALGQTLVIDMFNKTAKLNGTSVITNVSGDWVYLKPDNNRVTYTTNNNDAKSSTIYWQEVVG